MPAGIRSLFGATSKRQTSPLALQPEVPSSTIGNPAWAHFTELQTEDQYASDSGAVVKSCPGRIDQTVADAMSAAIASAVVSQIQARLVSAVTQAAEATLSRHEDRIVERVSDSLIGVLEKTLLPRILQVEAGCGSHEVKHQISVSSLGRPMMMGKASKDMQMEAPPAQTREPPPPMHRAPMWTAMKHFVRGSGEEGAKAPPSLDSLQDAADDGLFSEHRIGQRKEGENAGLFANPKVLGNRRMILGMQTPSVPLNGPGSMRHTLGTPVGYHHEASNRVHHTASSSSAHMPESPRMSGVVPSQQDAALTGIGDAFSYYHSHVSGVSTPATNLPTTGGSKQESSTHATTTSELPWSTSASAGQREKSSPSPPPAVHPRPPSARPLAVLACAGGAREGRSASPTIQGRPSGGASASAPLREQRKPWPELLGSLDSTVTTATGLPEQRRRASEGSMPPRVLKRQDSESSASIEAMSQSATAPNLCTIALDEPGSPKQKGAGSRRTSLELPPDSRALQRRHTSPNEMANFAAELAQTAEQKSGLVRETSGESVMHSVSLTMGVPRSRTPPPGRLHHSQQREQRCVSPDSSSVMSPVCAQALARNPCRESPQPEGQEGTGIMERFKRRLSGPVDEVAALRHARETELLKEIERPDDPMSCGEDATSEFPTSDCSTSGSAIFQTHAGREVAAPWQLQFWGILPWKGGPHKAPKFPNISWKAFKTWVLNPETYRCTVASIYQRTVLTVSIATVVFGVENLMAAQRGRLREAERGAPLVLCFQEVTDLTIAVGSLIGLILMRRGLVRHNLLGSHKAMLVGYARRERLVEAWCHVTERENPVWAMVWLFVIAARALAPVQHLNIKDIDPLRWAISVASFAFCSGLFLALTQTVQHVVILLPMMVDAFCFHFVNWPYLDDNVRDWGLLQAALRRASNAVERCFFVLETITLVMVLTSVTAMALTPLEPMLHLWLLVAVLLVAAVEVRLFFKAAEVTEKCQRVPSLINSMCFGQNVDVDRHYLVEYVTYSAAGFYVFQVRLTAAMALKLAYVSVLLAFAVVTNIASKW